MPTLSSKSKTDMEKPPALNEHADYQQALATFSRAVRAHEHAAAQRRDWERRYNHPDDTVRAVAALEKPNVDTDYWRTKIEVDKAQAVRDRVQQEAKQPLRDYYVERDRQLVQCFYEALHTIIPLNNAIQRNWQEAQNSDVPIPQHFWHELLENVREWTSLLEHRRAMLRSEGIL